MNEFVKLFIFTYVHLPHKETGLVSNFLSKYFHLKVDNSVKTEQSKV